jgi:hypothetical protein
MRCLCGAEVLLVTQPCEDGPDLLDTCIHPCGIWTLDEAGHGGRLTVHDVWVGKRGHHRHECRATQVSEPTLFGVAG